MGHPIPPEPPVATCPDCCDSLPSSLSGKIVLPGVGDFTGTIYQNPIEKCHFSGILDGPEESHLPLYAGFCADSEGTLVMHTLAPPYGCSVANNHCSLPASCLYAGAMLFEVS